MPHSNLKLKPAAKPQPNLVAMPPAPNGGTPLPPKRRPRRNDEVSYLQEAEIERLFKVITSHRDKAIFRLAYHRGLRASEIGLLEVRDLDAQLTHITLHRLKGSTSGIYPLVREEMKALRAWLKKRGNLPGPLFPSRNHQPISRKRLDALMKNYGALAMIPERLRHFHVLKHSCGTHMASQGRNVEQIQDHLGHKNIGNTMIYVRVTNKRREQLGEELRDTWR